ncbi:MAG TPA: DNA translocase FtsK 4TM domain-containing protein [Flavobacteriales bacterium]|nr:DNA translocase FtsK 4TM domain-containing protein [Flavobacteriales bacterium]
MANERKNKLREPKEDERPSKRASKKSARTSAADGEGRLTRFRAFLGDERVHKLTGLFLVLGSLFAVTAFTSYLFTWRMDQDLMSRSWGEIFSPDVRVENWMGKFGALLSHRFIFIWFGVAAFSFVLWAFLAGIRMALGFWLLPAAKTFRWTLMALFWLPTLFGFLFPQGGWQIMGGGIGYAINNHLTAWLGSFGAGATIVFAAIAFTVYTFNPPLSWVADLFKRRPAPADETEEGGDVAASIRRNRIKADEAPWETEEAEVAVEEEEATEEPVDEEEEVEGSELESLEEEVEEEVEEEEETVLAEEEPSEALPVPPPVTAVFDPGSITEEINGFSVEAAVGDDALTEAEIERKLTEFGPFDPTLELGSYVGPTLDLLAEHSTGELTVTKEELEENKNKIVTTLNNYNIGIDKIKATIGPTVTLYEIVPQAGVRISKIKNLEDDIALSLAALGIRIIAPIPGKGTIGIEVPNSKPQVVSMRTVVASEKFQNSTADLPIVLGKTISNETFVTDLSKMPHLLMAGATGQGKSVGLNAILVSLLYKKHPSQIKFVLVDPKKVELTLFNKIERHFLAKLPGEGEAIITDTKKVVATLNSLCIEMDERYELLKDAGVRNIKEYNAKFVGRRLNPEYGHRFLPYIVLVVDEFADLIMTAGREVETPIARLAQLARAIGIHLIIATQRPSVNIITGTIKANFPARIAFRVTSKIDSRTILDAGGADQLIGRGDMLLSTGNDLIRIQCAFVDTPEVEAITEFIGGQRGYPDALLLPEVPTEEGDGGGDMDLGDRDSMFEEAARVVVQTQQGSTSLIQRKLKLGYNRAGRIVDQLEAAGILGAFEGSKARKVLVPTEQALDALLHPENSTAGPGGGGF